MRRSIAIGVCFALMSVALPLVAQDHAGNIARVAFWTIKAGMIDEFEEGLKKHNAFHGSANDPGALHTWVIVNGPSAGQYVRASIGNDWADFDREGVPSEADARDVAANLDPYLETDVPQHYLFLSDISKPPASEGIAPMSNIIFFRLHQDGEQAFRETITKVHEAISKTEWPSRGYFWHELWSGGAHPTFVLVLPMENWADMAPIEPSFPAMIIEAYGPEEGTALLETFGKTIKKQWSQIHQYRPDLSYVPAGD
jgi:hypothetical protein